MVLDTENGLEVYVLTGGYYLRCIGWGGQLDSLSAVMGRCFQGPLAWSFMSGSLQLHRKHRAECDQEVGTHKTEDHISCGPAWAAGFRQAQQAFAGFLAASTIIPRLLSEIQVEIVGNRCYWAGLAGAPAFLLAHLKPTSLFPTDL